MTISLERLLKHMLWANQRTIKHLQSLSEDSLKAYSIKPEWHVGEIIFHIVDSANEYANRLIIDSGVIKLDLSSIDDVNKISDLDKLMDQALQIDKKLLECLNLDDVEVEYKTYSGRLVKDWRSTILSQAIHHATEHRAQISSALEAKGFTPVDLDELDLWRYATEIG